MIDRRTFLQSSLAASAVGLAGSSAAAPSAGVTVRCGMIGIDHAHALDVLEEILKSDDIELVGICEPDDAIREAKKDVPILQGLPWVTEDVLLNDRTIQVVVVETGVTRLLQYGRAAIDAGKHLHIDKPPGTSLTEWKALLDAAEAKNLIVQMGYMYRYNPGFDLIRKAVREGWLGDVYSIQASMCTGLPPERRAQMAIHPGGIMLELGCHLIDMICVIMGPPQKVTPFLRHDAPTDEGLADNCIAVLEYENAMAAVEVAALEPAAFPTRRFKIVGPKGKIILEPIEPPKIRMYLSESAGGYEKGWNDIELPDLPRHARDLADLAACVKGSAEFAYSKEHDYQVQRTVLQACGEDV
ncbi:MAG: Gfo/Idh/MocA family oxidoreductase [Candidatus Hydrogenedentes bacterium]|nr:Gfo/Idh/MocA family oxidoreductase [Candidatus Hydrogenedentota bacterium]